MVDLFLFLHNHFIDDSHVVRGVETEKNQLYSISCKFNDNNRMINVRVFKH